VAERLGYLYIDTGAMYRAVAWMAREKGVPLTDPARLEAMVGALNLELVPAPEKGVRVLIDGRDITEAIRAPDMGEAASVVSTVSAVRRRMVELQRRLGATGGVVAEGRDVGSVVFPQADVKIYMDASVSERARRRRQDESARGIAREQTAMEEDLHRRDERDSSRDDSPLVCCPDAVVIDTTALSIDQQVERVLEEVRRHLR
jgi:cytidylate kinase